MSRTSLTPQVTAERETNLKEDEEGFGLGMAQAMVVLPVPGGEFEVAVNLGNLRR